MPPKQQTPKRSGPKGLTRLYLILYNALSFTLWASCTLRGIYLLATSVILPLARHEPSAISIDTVTSIANTALPPIFTDIFPALLITQSLATLEILHSLLGLVRAPIFTTAMQVASRLLVVWGVLYLFGGDIVGNAQQGAQTGDAAFLGCLTAWGVTECIRYGFFALQVLGTGVPGWWTWLRYNTFYVLYPLGITSECVLVVKALAPAGEFEPLYRWFLIAVLGIYVPGSYILYTHMIAQRKKVLKKAE
ncbi:phosphatase-like protein [Aspergillus steynii IBT 23096]|uniref:Very-long-chain (3R)-3-hydroxyacyl-CoA dehydratase n=1 Tax=Aspergillus steynii IBT 23096 TaxID=1392250 RepID=A0A2I2GPY0_9EURO|nr:phosphatase-like protein [Aspergillus steynii IBT 23096]PLB54934.1 phosphatase-like protein [Aspergillus steynii IBT 23096]